MKFGLKILTIVSSIIVVIILTTSLFLWKAFAISFKPPKDDQLLTTFYQHRSAFEKLRELVIEDSKIESYFSENELDSRIKGDRRKQYKQLFSEIRPGLTVNTDYDGTVRFIIAHGGISAAGSDWLKGIEYVPRDYKEKGAILSSLDDANKLPADVYLRRIELNWFLVYQRDD